MCIFYLSNPTSSFSYNDKKINMEKYVRLDTEQNKNRNLQQ